jgi:hypothetical protein
MDLGIIEGVYGPLWPPEARDRLVRTLAWAGYGFYHYAPKADPAVRTAWQAPWTDADAEGLRAFAAMCRSHGMRFGIGLTPLGLGPGSPRDAWDALAAKLRQLDAIGIDDLVLAFDDVRGDVPDLAAQQAAIVDWAAARTTAGRVYVCPTYFSDDPLLDRLFGARPDRYLEDLGAALGRRIRVYWTGAEICAKAIEPAHVEHVAERLGRAPVLWDNAIANDSPVTCQHLSLRGVTGRSAGLADVTAGHALNPALQPSLTAIPALTLPMAYNRGTAFTYDTAFREAAEEVCGTELAATLHADLPALCDWGRDRLEPETHADLRARYAAIDHPAAREVVAWLDGAYDPGGAGAPG